MVPARAKTVLYLKIDIHSIQKDISHQKPMFVLKITNIIYETQCTIIYINLKTLNGSWLSSFAQCSVHPVYNDVIICLMTFPKIFQNIKGISKRISRRNHSLFYIEKWKYLKDVLYTFLSQRFHANWQKGSVGNAVWYIHMSSNLNSISRSYSATVDGENWFSKFIFRP